LGVQSRTGRAKEIQQSRLPALARQLASGGSCLQIVESLVLPAVQRAGDGVGLEARCSLPAVLLVLLLLEWVAQACLGPWVRCLQCRMLMLRFLLPQAAQELVGLDRRVAHQPSRILLGVVPHGVRARREDRARTRIRTLWGLRIMLGEVLKAPGGVLVLWKARSGAAGWVARWGLEACQPPVFLESPLAVSP